MRGRADERLACFVLALLLSATTPAFGQTGKCPAGAEPRHVVVTIGVDHYQHSDRWPNLHTAVNDANSLENVLETKFGYESYESLVESMRKERPEPLREGKATRDAIDSLVKDGLQDVLCPGDDFILFFSGHGDSRQWQDGGAKNASGYLVPADAPEQGHSHLIEVKEFLEDINHLPARHILVILDACYSGIAIQDALQGMRSSGEYQAALASRKSRKVIVSAQPDQTASDHGSIRDHSLFGGLLFQALDQGLAAKGKDFIADADLGEFLKQHVFEAAQAAPENRRQLPDWVPFVGNEGGALVLNLNQDMSGLYHNAMQSLLTGEYVSFRLNATRAAHRSPDDPMALALQYRLALREGNINTASSSIDKLLELETKGLVQSTSVELNRHELQGISRQLVFWKNALQLPIPAASPVVDIHVYTGETEQHLLPLSGSNEFNAPAEANLYFKLRAKAEETYVYVFLIDKLGRIHSEGNFLNQRQNPINPNLEQLCTVQSGPDPNDLQEWHFVFSPHPIDEFSSPPSDTSRGGTPATISELAGVTRYVITIRPEE